MNTRNSTDEIEELITRYIALSAGMRFAEKRAFWDEEETTPVLAPEELGVPLLGWREIDAYWGETRSALLSLQTEYWDLVVSPLSDSIAIALFKQRWVSKMAGPAYLAGAPLASTVRVTMGLRRRRQTWKIFMSVESHVDGVAYFRSVLAHRAVTLSST